ncbi:MAG: PDZ domain-containing protein [Wenzhouxiangellaceae bacterium]|nr:PDZ domain-containing protein [Wenzhouxiangellaceae bacterium]
MRSSPIWLALLLTLAGAVRAEPTALLRQPALSAEHLAFVYAGDLWVAARDGTNARRLTSSPAEENTPIFSPDGRQIAFAADYEGNTDVYVIAVDGGQPERLTWHPAADVPVDWTRDGAAVAFVSNRETDHGRSGQLFHARLSGGLPEKQMEARFFRGAYDASGRFLAYIDHGSGYNGLFGGTAGWKGYRGGTTPSIRILDLDKQEIVARVPGERVTDFNLFWLADQLYFLSDRDDETFNLFRFDRASGRIDKLSDEREFDILAAAGHGSEVVYATGGRLKRLALDSGTTETLAITLAPDLPQLRPGWKSVAETIQGLDISPNGKRAIVTARGEVFTVPADQGSTRNLTTSDGVREYAAMWSPEGDQVAWIVESLAGQTLVVADQTGIGETRTFKLGPDFYDLEAWHGKTGRIVFSDNHLGLHAITLDSGKIARIATNTRRAGFDVAFSPDGRWLAFNLEQPNFHADLALYDFESGETRVVTQGRADVAAPAFDPDGNYLYFAASTNAGPLQVGLNMTSQERPYRAGLYALVLAADGKSPLAPETGDEEAGDDSDEGNSDKKNSDKKNSGKKNSDKKDDKDKKKTKATRIDFDGLLHRMVGLPVAEDNYSSLQVAGDGSLFYIASPQPGAVNRPPGESGADDNRLLRFDFDKGEASGVQRGVRAFRIAAGGKHMLLQTSRGLAIAEVGKKIEPEALDTSGLRMFIDPRAEWAQIFDEGWRMQKQYFYADNLHGLDWDAVYAKYRPLLDHVGRREDLNALMVEMIAELQAGHNRVGGGDVHRESGANAGLLGANFVIENGKYRIASVYSGEAWTPFLHGPLSDPGNQARQGEYLLAIDGKPLDASANIFRELQGTAGRQLRLTVGPNADGRDARDIVVTPTASERELRLWTWIENNRQAVSDATDGRVGYIYLPNTAGAGYTFFNRMFYSQLDKDALIIDERSNGGGQAADYIVQVLSRRHLSSWKDRDGLPYNTPAGALHEPKLMLIDQDAGSGGDYLPYAFRHLGIGKLMGTRTWGGLIGISANPQLIDGGVMTVPFFRFVDADGNWTIENEGVAPDINIELDPIATNRGRDTQLEAAIEHIVGELQSWQSPVPPVPPLPTELGR